MTVYTVRLTDGIAERTVEVEGATAEEARSAATEPGWTPVFRGTKPKNGTARAKAVQRLRGEALRGPVPYDMEAVRTAALTAVRRGSRRHEVATVAETLAMVGITPVAAAGLCGAQAATVARWFSGQEVPDGRHAQSARILAFLTRCIWAAYRIDPNMRTCRHWLTSPAPDGRSVVEALLENVPRRDCDIAFAP